MVPDDQLNYVVLVMRIFSTIKTKDEKDERRKSKTFVLSMVEKNFI